MQHELDFVEQVRAFVKKAIAIAEEVPEPFRVPVFNKVFDLQIVTNGSPEAQRPAHTNEAARRPASVNKPRAATGPKAMAAQLLDSGFLIEARTVEAVDQHLRLNFARTFASKDLSKALIRLVQEGRLLREKTPEGKLAYRAKN